MYAEYVRHCRMWQDQLLLSAPNLTVLSLRLHAYYAPKLWKLPLRHLELVEAAEQPWLMRFLEDVRHITTLESLTICFQDSHGPLPDFQMESSNNLKHFKLQRRLPTGKFSLPGDCLLHLTCYCGPKCKWERHSQAIERHTSVLRIGVERLEAWPAGIQHFSKLQCLVIELSFGWSGGPAYTEPLRLTELQHIPHVRLVDFARKMPLRLTAGSWQSLDIRGALYLDIADIQTFLEGTKKFTLDIAHKNGNQQDTAAAISSACHSSGVKHYDCSATAIRTSERVFQEYKRHANALCGCDLPILPFCSAASSASLFDINALWPEDPSVALGWQSVP